MATQFVSKSRVYKGATITKQQWLDRTLKSNLPLKGDAEVKRLLGGTPLLQREACVVFKDMTFTPSNAKSSTNYWRVDGTFEGIYSLSEGLKKTLCVSGWGAVPLGMPTQTRFPVLNQTASHFLTAGSYNLEDGEEIVVPMYFGAMQILAYQLGICTDPVQREDILIALVCLVRAMRGYNSLSDISRRATEELTVVAQAQDSLQKAMAFVLMPEKPWDTKQVLDLFEVVAKRTMTRTPGNDHSLGFGSTAYGPLVTFLVVPVLREYVLDDGMKLHDVMRRVEMKVQELSSLQKRSPEKPFMAVFLEYILDRPGCVSAEAAGKIAGWLRAKAPVDWSVIGETMVEHCFDVEASTNVDVQSHSETKIEIRGRDVSRWSAAVIKPAYTPGVYTIFPITAIGNATKATGNTKGKQQTSNWRVCTGKTFDGPGYSVSGMERTSPPYSTAPSNGYVMKTPLNYENPIEVRIYPDQVELWQGVRRFWQSPRSPEDPVSLGFKFCSFIINKDPGDLPVFRRERKSLPVSEPLQPTHSEKKDGGLFDPLVKNLSRMSLRS